MSTAVEWYSKFDRDDAHEQSVQLQPCLWTSKFDCKHVRERSVWLKWCSWTSKFDYENARKQSVWLQWCSWMSKFHHDDVCEWSVWLQWCSQTSQVYCNDVCQFNCDDHHKQASLVGMRFTNNHNFDRNEVASLHTCTIISLMIAIKFWVSAMIPALTTHKRVQRVWADSTINLIGFHIQKQGC